MFGYIHIRRDVFALFVLQQRRKNLCLTGGKQILRRPLHREKPDLLRGECGLKCFFFGRGFRLIRGKSDFLGGC